MRERRLGRLPRLSHMVAPIILCAMGVIGKHRSLGEQDYEVESINLKGILVYWYLYATRKHLGERWVRVAPIPPGSNGCNKEIPLSWGAGLRAESLNLKSKQMGNWYIGICLHLQNIRGERWVRIAPLPLMGKGCNGETPLSWGTRFWI